MAKSKSSGRWLQEHFDDKYVKMARKAGYRSRAVYKLIEIQDKYHIIKPGHVVVDLGAAPGGWSQIATKWVKPAGKVIALDILDMTPLEDVSFILGDFQEEKVLLALEALVKGAKVNVVMSDMAPNMSGLKAVDQPKGMYLADLSLDFAVAHLSQRGCFITKLFHGEGFDAYIVSLRKIFKRVIVLKPDASRSRSPEVYAVGIERQ